MSSKITNPQIDMLYDEAKKAGALGGKLLGAGGGGFLLVYCPYNVKHQVARRLEAAGGQLMDWNFELRGAQSWICDEDRWDYRDIQGRCRIRSIHSMCKKAVSSIPRPDGTMNVEVNYLQPKRRFEAD